jgi:hypothetical protein
VTEVGGNNEGMRRFVGQVASDFGTQEGAVAEEGAPPGRPMRLGVSVIALS